METVNLDDTLLKAEKAIVKAKITLLLDYPFWGSKALRLDYYPSDKVGTACTNGKWIKYDPDFINSLSHRQIVFLLAHEIGHIHLGHATRRNDRDVKLWNYGGDFAINYILRKCMVGDPIEDGQFKGLFPENFDEFCKNMGFEPNKEKFRSDDMSAEEWYAMIKKKDEEKKRNDQEKQDTEKGESDSQEDQEDQDSDGQGQGGDKGGDQCGDQGEEETECDTTLPSQEADENKEIFGIGGVIDTPEDENDEGGKDVHRDPDFERKSDLLECLKAAKGCGSVPQWLERKIMEEINHDCEPMADDLLRDWLSEKVMGDYTYSKPSYKSWYSNFILPGQETDAIGHVVICIDTSGSINPETLSLFKDILNELKEKYDFDCTVIYSDCEVKKVESYTKGENIEFVPVGGGGTDFKPAFDYVEQELVNENIVGLIYFTDLDCNSYPVEPDYPVLWLTNSPTREPELGEVIRLPKTK